MSEIVEQLRREHADMGRLLDMLNAQIEVFNTGEVPDYDLLQEIVDYCLDYPDACHHPLEDAIFEHVLVRAPGPAEKVREILTTHETLGQLTRGLYDTLDQVVRDESLPRDQLASVVDHFIGQYRDHMSMEEEHFFPLAERVLTEGDWATVADRHGARIDPLSRTSPDRRFGLLRESILGVAPDAANL